MDFLTSMEPPNESLFDSIEANDAETFFAMNENDRNKRQKRSVSGVVVTVSSGITESEHTPVINLISIFTA